MFGVLAMIMSTYQLQIYFGLTGGIDISIPAHLDDASWGCIAIIFLVSMTHGFTKEVNSVTMSSIEHFARGISNVLNPQQ